MANLIIVDDDTAIRQQLTVLFRQRRHIVFEADSGSQTIEILENPAGPRFDLILLDLIMPNGHGFDVIEALRLRLDRPKIVAMSGKGNPSCDYLAHSLSRGADWAFAKGGALAELAQAVDTLLAGGTIKPRTQAAQPARLRWPSWLLRQSPAVPSDA
jgi:DNA-binding response OmpR family regulator